MNGYSVYLGDDEEGLGVDTGDDYTTPWGYLMLPKCTRTNALNDMFMLCVFYHNKEKTGVEEEG